jgi:DNA polymerase elongation subunit (family B)
MVKPSFLILDIETDSKDESKANLKYFGAYSYLDEKYYLLDYTKKEEIKQVIKDHKYIVGFNNISFDQPIIQKYLEENVFKYKIILDLWQVLAPSGNKEYNKHNKNRLCYMNYTNLKDYKLKTIVETLKLDEFGKGDIDYSILQKESWTKEEIKLIEEYLKQDVVITKKLFNWLHDMFYPLAKFLDKEDVRKLKHLKSSMPSLAYQIVCNKAKLPVEWEENKPKKLKSYSGGHHVEARWKTVKGNIIEIDFNSAYPHVMMMCNLYSPAQEGWSGGGYFKVDGCYNNKEMGKVEGVIKEIYQERLKAKKENDLAKSISYKLIINAAYGLTGNYKFKSLYNHTTASDCTSIVRTLMKKLAKQLDENGFDILYGFTDSLFIKIPEESNKKEVFIVVDSFIQEVKTKVPFPLETFGMDVKNEIKFIWFISKNNYLFVTKDDEIKYTQTLLNKNAPQVALNVFENYIKPKIIKELDVKFTVNELKKEIKKVLETDIELAAEEYVVNAIKDYKVKTSIQYQISKQYGEGKHFLIPNIKKVGIGKGKSYCSIDEFKQNKLTISDIDFNTSMKWLEPFTKNIQTKLQ